MLSFIYAVIYAWCHLCWLSFMLSVFLLNVILLSGIMLSSIMLSGILLSVIMLSVIYAEFHLCCHFSFGLLKQWCYNQLQKLVPHKHLLGFA
jgi:hypothetical protein